MSLRGLPTEVRNNIGLYLGRPQMSKSVLRIDPEYLIGEIGKYIPGFTLEGMLDYLVKRERAEKEAEPAKELFDRSRLGFIDYLSIERAGPYRYSFDISSWMELDIKTFLPSAHSIDYLSYYEDGKYRYEGSFVSRNRFLVEQLNTLSQLSIPPLAPLIEDNYVFYIDENSVRLPRPRDGAAARGSLQ
jgi:hypothetical protein